MKIIKNYTKKLLKDLEDCSEWEDDLFSIKNKKYGFEIFQPTNFLFLEIWKCPGVKFNLIERILIWRKSSKIKKRLLNDSLEFDYFKN